MDPKQSTIRASSDILLIIILLLNVLMVVSIIIGVVLWRYSIRGCRHEAEAQIPLHVLRQNSLRLLSTTTIVPEAEESPTTHDLLQEGEQIGTLSSNRGVIELPVIQTVQNLPPPTSPLTYPPPSIPLRNKLRKQSSYSVFLTIQQAS
jgi:hypothetical protein